MEAKSEPLFVRVKPAEKKAIEEAAGNADLSISEWVRVVILQKLGLVKPV